MSENHYTKLASIDVSKYVEKKQNLTYLSWPFAVDQLMRHDPQANWVFNDPIMFGETMMVSCTVTAFGKPVTMHLPVMDHRNQAIKNPGAFEVNKNMMRCLVKAIACHGLGIHIYAGEDLPLETLPEQEAPKARPGPKPVEKPAQKPVPAVAEGREGSWQLRVTAEPDGVTWDEWADLVIETAKLGLGQCETKAQVLEIFKVNRNIFDRMKAEASGKYEEMMAAFKEAKEKFKE
jgi:hypothetical protein